MYWSVPKNWFPGGVLLEPEGVAALLHVLVRVPPSPARARLLSAVKGHAPKVVVDAIDRITPPRTSDIEEQLLPPLLSGLSELAPLRVRYWTASRGAFSMRTVSVQRVLVGPPTRFVGWCHSSASLRWFRLDYAASMSRDVTESYHCVDDAEVDGYRGEKRVKAAFFVRDPDARWVAQNLPEGLSGTSEDGGLLVETETTGLLPVARFVVGLGEVAQCRTPELAELVRKLAEGALRQAGQG